MSATQLASRQVPAGGGASEPIDEIASYAFAYEEFWNQLYNTQFEGGLTENHSGTGATATNTAGEQGAPGIQTISTGTASAGRGCLISYYTSGIRLGGGKAVFETRVRVPTLSDGTNTFTVRLGWLNDGGGEPTNGVFFRYTHGTNSGKWQGVARAASAEGSIDLSIGPVTTGWQKLRIVFQASGNQIDFYINGSLVGSLTDNTKFPTASGREVGACLSIVKSAGTIARSFLADYVAWQLGFGTIGTR